MLEGISEFKTGRCCYIEIRMKDSVTKQKVKDQMEQKDTRFSYSCLPIEISKLWCHYHTIQS